MRRQRNLLGPQGMGGMVGLWGASSMVNSIQYGQIDLVSLTTNTATITSVNTANAMLVFLGESSVDQNPAYIGAVRMTLTNATRHKQTVLLFVLQSLNTRPELCGRFSMAP
jgi:hypothetical protein